MCIQLQERLFYSNACCIKKNELYASLTVFIFATFGSLDCRHLYLLQD